VTTERRFDPITVPVDSGGGWRRVHRIACTECPITYDISANTRSGSRANEDLLKVLKRGGWTVGRNPAHDLCPDCTSTRRRKTDKAEPMNAKAPIAEKLSVEAPRAPSFDERRLILMKLQDHYVSETVGYDRGWSDKKVAENLGVAWKWVADLRAANFGPARDNDDVREILAEAKAIQEETGKILAAANDHLKQADTRGSAIEKSIAALRERQTLLDRRVADVEKAVR
jgi:hypothetical protein